MLLRIRYSSNYSLRVSGSYWFLRDVLYDIAICVSPKSDSRVLESLDGWCFQGLGSFVEECPMFLAVNIEK